MPENCKNKNGRVIPEGELILRQGDEGYCACLIESGRVRVFVEREGRIIDLADLGAGEILGEMALLGEGVHGANVVALEPTILQCITPELFEEKLKDSDPLIRSLLKMLMERVKRTNEALVASETREFIEIGFE